ncbi:TOBE domain-containing protein [Spelaeicoccus albus]|uniref:Molybdopterin-binding protein n=1 Tax=Spelaeicoccus albus TaxID=1280376 RepID=A0A7Z0D1M5_9MICO|nr:TOBE domain-containing protein [Spelaeicoccus albus]NYI66355.1 molybdopterin-binding protein [Spelaeicoccus albus]
MTAFRISQAARLLAVSDDTIRRWIDSGRLKPVPGTSPQKIDGKALAGLALEIGQQSSPSSPGQVSPSSARNRFPGIVTRIKEDTVMAQVDIQAGPFRVVSLISVEAVRDLGLEVGAEAVAMVKSTNVIMERSTT